MDEYDVFSLIENDRMDAIGFERNPISDAIRALHVRFDAEKLRPILASTNRRVSTNGLHILSELGTLGCEVIEDAIRHVRHPNWEARFYLADTLLACNKSLSVTQVYCALPLASDPEGKVRCKIVELFSKVPLDLLSAAVDCIEEQKLQALHRRGIEILEADEFLLPDLDRLSDSRLPVPVYGCAKIIREASAGMKFSPAEVGLALPDEADYLRWRLKRLGR